MGIWDVTSGKLLRSWKGKPHLVWNLAFSPNGKLLASGLMGGSILFWDSESGKELKPLMGHTALVPCVAFSPDGRTLASGSADKTIKLWDLASGNELQTLKSPYEVQRVTFSPDGRLLAVSAFEFPEGMVQLWRLQP
jgi:WD40 repeat protein